ncbi:MAG: fatty acid desaturase [Bacteroidota bacterium]
MNTGKVSAEQFDYRTYTTPKNWLSALAILLNYLVIGGLAYLSYFHLHWAFYLPIVFVIAVRQNALIDALGHDATHYNLFSSRKWCRRMEFVLFIPFLYSFDLYRKEHARHHAFLMQDDDPAYQNYQHWGVLDPNPKWTWIWWIRPFLLYDLPSILTDFWGNLRRDADFRAKTLIFWGTLIGLSIGLGFWPLLLLYWLVPLLWLVPVIEYWTEVADHYAPDPEGDTRDSRGLFLGRFLRGHYDGYHTLHHLYPRIPWYNLKRATRDYERIRGVEKIHGLGEMFDILQDKQHPVTAPEPSADPV